MPQRCVFLVPETDKLDLLQRLRASHDPLADKVPPHITVVFPFTLDWDRGRLAALLDRQGPRLPIAFSLGRPCARDGCLCFPLVAGRPAVTAIHDALYTSLPQGLLLDIPYVPHLTFGRVGSGREVAAVLREARAVLPCHGVIRRMVLERVGTLEETIVEHEVTGP